MNVTLNRIRTTLTLDDVISVCMYNQVSLITALCVDCVKRLVLYMPSNKY